MFYKRAFYSFLYTLLGSVFIFLSVIIISDPYMIFHSKWFRKGELYGNMRVQAYGLIKFEDFDSIILGTSMLENTSAKEASTKLGGHFINLSLAGASYFERLVVLDHAIMTKEINRIIMSIDFKFNELHEIGDTFFPRLYAGDLSEKFKFYFHSIPMKCVFLNKCDFKKIDLDRPNKWYDKEFHNRRFGGFDNWLKYQKSDHQIKDVIKILQSDDFMGNVDLEKSKKIIDSEIIPLFSNKNVQFDLIIPPYNILWWKKLSNKEKILAVYEYLIQQSEKYPNVKIYWFYDEDFPADISSYKDLTHYHQSINSLQIDAIKNGTHLITTKNYQQKFRKWMRKVNHFDIRPYMDKITGQ